MNAGWQLSARDIADRVNRREVSPVDIVQAFLERIDAVDGAVGAFTAVYPERALQVARDVERRVRAGKQYPLAGVPYGLKDMTDTAGIITTYGAQAFKDHVPDRDAAVASRLAQSGGVFLGKTNTPEFANRATTAYGLFPATHNPWGLDRTAGGSSGGSAAAVAAGMCPVAEGSDGGGSIRIPSSCCGVVGLKPSRGRISNAPRSTTRGGLVTHGPIGRTVRDVALMLDVMHGAATGDPYWAPPPTRPFLAAADEPPRRRRIAVLATSDKPIEPPVVAAVERTAELLRNLGHDVHPAGPDLTGLGPIFRVLVEAEAASEPPPGLNFTDPYGRWCYDRGLKLSAAEYITALNTMHARARQIVAFFDDWDCLLTPTVTLVPQPLDQFLAVTERVAEDDLAYIPFTFPFNMTGQPAISLPLGWSEEGLPIGVQLVGRPADEHTIIALAAHIEEATPWFDRWPMEAAEAS